MDKDNCIKDGSNILPVIMTLGSRLSVLLWMFLSVTGCSPATDEVNGYLEIDNHIEDKNFFKARALLDAEQQLTERQKLIAEAKVDHAFNALDLSNQKIDRLFKVFSKGLADSVQLELLLLKTRNHGKQFAYQKAYHAMDDLLTNHGSILTEKEFDDYRNERKIWKILASQPAQTISVKEKTVLPIIRDKAQLPNLKVNSDSQEAYFVFDTGANLSTATETTAGLFNMTLLEGTIEVGAITGTKIQARLAVCPEFRLGGIQVKNAVFIVFPDSALAFPQIDYQIKGILGFPVIEALKEIKITRSGQFIVPKTPSTYSRQNLALDFLTPVVQIEEDYYTFDSGAQHTQLYTKYFMKHKKKIEEKYEKTRMRFGGAGGLITTNGYYIEFSPIINGQSIAIDSVRLLTENVEESRADFYGNIGQDLIRKFDHMTINFESMFIRFE